MGASRLADHRRIWARKPVLADIYAVWFEALIERLPARGRVLEVGAGPGFLSEYAQRRAPGLLWVSTDVLETDWNDVVADGQRLPFRSGSFDAVVALDLIHHLARPLAFFGEAARVLRAGGRLAAVEPWITPLSYPVYRWLHHEGVRNAFDPWNPFPEGAVKDAFDGDAGAVWRLLRRAGPEDWIALGFRAPRLTILNGFAYLLSLGFRSSSLLPPRLAPLLIDVDRRAGALAPYVGLRALCVWDLAGNGPREPALGPKATTPTGSSPPPPEPPRAASGRSSA